MFKSVAKEKRLLMWTFYLVSMSGTAQTALSAGIDVMQRTVFSDKSLSAIQTVMFLPSLLGVVSGILSAVLISTGIATKKALTVIGVVLAALVGVLAGFLHTAFWQIIVFGVMIGIGMGFFIPTSQSIMLDNFDEKERQLISGFQFAFINLGGIIMSVLSGLVLTLAWYGGYLLLLLFIPIAVMAVVVLPRGERLKRSAAPVDGKTRGKGLPALVFYYTVVLFLFSLLYNAAASNLSTHLSQSNLGTAATAGIAMALLLAGGVVSGAFFGRLSARLDDYMIPLAFLILFVGYTFLNLFAGSLLLTLIATFVAGDVLLPVYAAMRLLRVKARGPQKFRSGLHADCQRRARLRRLFVAGHYYPRYSMARRGVHAVPVPVCRPCRPAGRSGILCRHTPAQPENKAQ